ncbi:MAG: RdgB/HAM1 family non-canonical purine NTP pyrophosphatase [Candidatus Omnitrophica bacterium]|nr:RdgB/HAM1 family non-canonical purine NTP pyrophosphatase [Candidatus Omnitrophota bacterium]
MDILLATFNQNKAKEITEIAKDLKIGLNFLYLKDFSNIKEAIEDGSTFKENAVKKAKSYYAQTGLITLAEDSGLTVDALNGAPGVYSSRFSGEDKDDYKNNIKLLHILEGADRREARFICVAALALSKDRIETFEGVLEGDITDQMKGSFGFGYDPVFIPAGFDKTLAELGMSVKNRISHRNKAIRQALEYFINTNQHI